MSTKRGALIVFEGIDRSGKTTQSLKLVDYLNSINIPTVHMRFPDRTTSIGRLINDYLTNSAQVEDHTIHLLFSANRWEARDRILAELNAGRTVVVDRYAYSGVVFTASKGLDLEWCKNPDKGLPAPDVVIYLSLAVEDAMKRGQFGEEKYEKKEIQMKVRELFELIKDDCWITIDANRDMETIEKQVREIACEVIKTKSETPIGKLWM